MTKHASLTLAAALLTLGAGGSAASAQGFGYSSGSAGGAAMSLGFTAGPPIARNNNVPVVAAPVTEPAATGSILHRDRAWMRSRHR